MRYLDMQGDVIVGDTDLTPWSVDFGINCGLPVPVDGTYYAFGASDVGAVANRQDQVAGGTTKGGIGNATTTAASLPAEPASPTAFNLVVNWDSSVASAPTGFTTGVLAAVKFLETEFTDPITVTIDVGYDEIDGNAIGSGNLGSSLSNFTSVTYANLLAAVKKDATTATDTAVVAALPATTPVTGANYWVTTAQAKALGLTASNTTVDGYIGFGASSLFTFGDTATSGTVAAGTYDFFATVVHEITEDMGRQLLTGQAFGGLASSYSLMDMLHYSAAGTRDFSSTTAGYFSPNGGVTNDGAFNTVTGGDAGDWAASVAGDPFDAFASSGALEKVSANDLTVMDAIGWNYVGSIVATNTSTPTGVTVAAVTTALAAAQSTSGLAAKASLATFTQIGGLAADTYSYTLGGTGAASCTLTTASNVATLAVATSAAGATNGKLYALTVTPKDTTSGNSGPASAVNVVVGSSANDTIKLSSLSGVVTSAPTFIYALAGNDTVSGTGMTGKLYFVGGAGADTLTGGSGVNDYEYGAVGDSTTSTMDVITNFKVAVDLIDLTGIGTKLTYAGAIASTGTAIAADSIGFQDSGGNTFVYVNATSASEKLTAASMKIELQGTIALTTSNFAHL
jgi:hypothetical protein